MLNGRFQIFLRKRQNQYSNPDTGTTYNVLVQCNPLTGFAEYVPGNVDNTWYDFTDQIEGSEKLSFTWDKVNSGDSSNTDTNADGSNYDKGLSSDLLFFDAAYYFIYNWLLKDECQILNAVEVKIVDLIAHGTYRIFEIKNDNIEYAPVDDPCQFKIKLREQDEVWHCVHKTFIWDNWQHWFEDSNVKQHPCFLTCIEPRPRLVQSARMALMFFFYSNPNIALITWIAGGSIEDDTRKILNANRFVDAPLVRTYIENVAGKCGLETDTIFDEGQHWQNLCLYYPQAGFMWESDEDAAVSPSQAYHFENRWLITIAELFDKLKKVFAAEWYVTPNNTIVFKYTKDLINLEPIYDFTAAGAEPIYELVYTFNGEKKPAYGRYEYQTDGSDLASQEVANLYNDIVDYDGPQYNPMLEGSVTKNLEFAPTGFVRDGRAKDYMRLLINDGETGAYILLGVLIIVGLLLSADLLPAGPALIAAIAVWAALIASKAENMRDIFVDGPVYSGAVRLTSEQVLTPRLILWDGVSMARAKAEAQFSLPDPNPYYNTTGTPYNEKNNIAQDNPNHWIYNYPLYFDSEFEGNLFDNYHDEIDNPLKSKESHQEAKWFVDLCEGMLNLFGVFENQYAVIGKIVLLERRDNYNVYVRIGNINVDYESHKINLKGTVLRRTGASVQTSNTSNISLRTVLVGLNGNLSSSPVNYSDAGLRAAIGDIPIEIIRYPGGEKANDFNWETGRDDAETGQVNSLEDLATLVSETGCEVSFVLNMVTKTMENQIAMLTAAHDLGINIKFVEMGNEMQGFVHEDVGPFFSPEEYFSTAEIWKNAIKAKFPGCLCAYSGKDKVRFPDWNSRSIPYNPDALIWHEGPEPADFIVAGVVDKNLLQGIVEQDFNDGFSGVSVPIWPSEFNYNYHPEDGPLTDQQSYDTALYMLEKIYELIQGTDATKVMCLRNVVGNEAAIDETFALTSIGEALKQFMTEL